MKKLKFIIPLVLVFSILAAVAAEHNYFITGLASSLKPGDRGEEVEELQLNLKNWGFYEGDVDGAYGWTTFRSIRKYQEECGLPVSGIADTNTLLTMGLTMVVGSGEAYAQARRTSNVQLLARAINGEARGEPYTGQVAVGAVILNRTRDSRFPKTIAGVIYQPRAFTAVADGQINVPIDPKSTVVKAARDALNGWDPTNGCVYYWNPATATSKWIWSRKIVKKIGKHYFGK
ncbi:MAG: spore cortex-lytic enzyme [Clostridia bacterium]|nr:spore cortex-lytic enzyme [Clostridia bacterium]